MCPTVRFGAVFVANLTVRFGAVINPTVRFGAVPRKRFLLRCGANRRRENRMEPCFTYGAPHE